jgi:hypothetical protein
MPGIKQVQDKGKPRGIQRILSLKGPKPPKVIPFSGTIPDICRLDELPDLVGVGEKALFQLMREGVFDGYKRAAGSGNATRVVKEEILKLITYLQTEYNYTDYKWQKGDADYD